MAHSSIFVSCTYKELIFLYGMLDDAKQDEKRILAAEMSWIQRIAGATIDYRK